MELPFWRSNLRFLYRAAKVQRPPTSRNYARPRAGIGYRLGSPRELPSEQNMRVELTVVSAPTADSTGTAIIIGTERAVYAFGQVSEAYQRTVKYHAVPWTKPRQSFFLAGPAEWDTLGGLPGLLLSLAGVADSMRLSAAEENAKRKERGRNRMIEEKKYNIPIHGADNLSHILAALRPLVLRQPIKINLQEHREDPAAPPPADRAADWQDEYSSVWKIPVRRPRSGSPWKRRHSDASPDESETNRTSEAAAEACSEANFKARPGPSNPFTAKWIVENGMLDGTMDNQMILAPKQARDLGPTEEALKIVNGQLTPYQRPQDDQDSTKSDELVYVQGTTKKPVPGGVDLKNRPLPRTTYGETCMSYIFKSRDHRGKFDPVTAKAKGVEPKEFKRLIAGETLVTPTGEVVTPDMVLGPTLPGRGVAFASIPTSDLVDAFFDRPEWTEPSLMKNVVSMYWMLGQGLYNHPRIVEYMRSQPNIRHILCAPDTSPNVLSNPFSAEFTTRLYRIDPDRFPVLKFDQSPQVKLPEDYPAEPAVAGERYTLMPHVEPETIPNARILDLPGAIQRMPSTAVSLAQDARKKAEDPAFLAQIEEDERDLPNRDAEIICLGTSSSAPSDIRGLCGTLVRVPGIGNYLLDCGEGSLGQVYRSFGEAEAGQILAELKCIVISHLHGDHVLGIVSMIQAWYKQMLKDGNHESKLVISCSYRVMDIIRELAQAEDFGSHRLHFPNCGSSPRSSDREVLEATAAQLDNGAFGLASIKRIPVNHCPMSCGTQLELTSGLRIAWSGDCRPSMEFADACRGAHLLVHEATFDDDEIQHAKDKKHSTRSEALSVAHRMQAHRTILTHFSTRYTGAVGLQDEGGKVLMGWDFMRVKLGDFKKAALFVPAIERLRQEEAGEVPMSAT